MGRNDQQARKVALNRSEGFGERLLGTLLDRGHEMPPQLIAPLVAEEVIERAGRAGDSVQEAVRALSHGLTQARGGITTDDTTLLMVEWRGGSADHLATVDL